MQISKYFSACVSNQIRWKPLKYSEFWQFVQNISQGFGIVSVTVSNREKMNIDAIFE